MKRLKKAYQENRVFVILMTIVLICVVIMAICLVNYFYGTKDSSVYGSRLDGIENVEVTNSKLSEIENKIKEDASVETVSIIIKGKLIYTTILFNDTVTLVDAQSKAVQVLDSFSEEEKAFYDFHFMLKQKASDKGEGFNISGAKNVSGTNLVWNNNLEVTKEENNEEQ